MMLAVVVVAIGWIVATPAGAEEKRTVGDLLAKCRAEHQPASLICIAYIGGVSEMMNVLSVAENKSPAARPALQGMTSCGQVSWGAAQQAFVNWATAHPEAWEDDRLVGVVGVITRTWPCK
jgi:hypothetical protein